MSRIIYLDMDGVLVDFVTAAIKRFVGSNNIAIINHMMKTWPAKRGLDGLYDMLGINADKFWCEVNSGGLAFWRNLPIYPWYSRLVDLAESLGQVIILSSPSRGGNSAAGKLCWLEDNLPAHKRDFILTPKKYKHLVARPGDILIDDDPRTCRRWSKQDGISVLFPRPWNYTVGWENPMRSVQMELELYLPKKAVT